MEPRAILVLYEPGHKLKNHKYLLSLGPNIVGTDNKCQVVIDSKKHFPEQYVANFYLTQDFMYVEALCDNMVQFKSNMQIQPHSQTQRKKETFRYLDQNCRYVAPIQEIFYIGPYKAMVQIQTAEDLKNIHNLLNLENFLTPKQDESRTEKMDIENQQDRLNEFEVNSDKTQKIYSDEQNGFQPTLLIQDDQFNYEPTLLINDEQLIQDFNTQTMRKQRKNEKAEASYNLSVWKINSQYLSGKSQVSQMSFLSKEKQKKFEKFSQQMLYDTIKKEQKELRKDLQKYSKNNDENQDEDLSMPDTIKDNQSEKQLSNVENDEDDDEMPATLQDDYPLKNNHSESMKIIKGIQSLHQIQYAGEDLKIHKSETMKEQQQDYQEGDLWKALICKPIEKESNKVQAIQEVSGEVKKKFFIKTDIPLVIKNHFISNLEIVSSMTSRNSLNQKDKKDEEQSPTKFNFNKSTVSKKQQNSETNVQVNGSNSKKRLFKEEKKLRLVNLCGFKPKPEEKLILRKRGFQIVSDGNQQNYELLIISKNCKATPKLIIALLKNKWIVSEDWLYDKDWELKVSNFITGTIQGISWQIIQKNYKNKHLLKGCFFHLNENLSEYKQIVGLAGGQITTQLNKRKKTNILINCDSQKDKQFYIQNKMCKNWKFYDHRIISYSILTGEIHLEKYQIDSMSF